MKLTVYKKADDVPKHYRKHLARLGIAGGSIRYYFFDDIPLDNDEKLLHEVIIITNDNDIPVSWGIMVKGDRYNYKNAMFYTQTSYRRQGLASRIYNSMCKRHKKFTIFADSGNKGFFTACGRNVDSYL